MHTFTESDQGDGVTLFCVGYWMKAYDDRITKWHPLRDCNTAAEAAMWVNFLNGGEWPRDPRVREVIAEDWQHNV
jgi:hypothetical protein